MSWRRSDSELALLEEAGSPFGTPAFRSAVVAVVPGWRDLSLGAALDDAGVRAALPLLVRGRQGESLPPYGYGAVVSSAPLRADQVSGLLEFAFRQLRLRRLEVRTLDLLQAGGVGEPFARASVVATDSSPSAAYSRLARRSLAKAVRAGCVVEAGASAADFWPLYADASNDWAVRYPEALVRVLVASGTARVHAVRLRGAVVSALLTLVCGDHWMCWLAAQSPVGREVAASYLAYDALLAEAHAAGVPAVNLGASVAGGAEFKQHLGAATRSMFVWRREVPVVAGARRVRGAAAALLGAVRGR